MDLEVVESLKESGRCTGSAPILVPSPDAEFAVVSDLDDTVIKSSATTTLRQLEILFTHDARSRAAFAGVEPLYHALVAGPDGRGVNPIFYVSRAGWNLYDLFRRFLEDKDIPRGPMFLQDLAIGDSKSSAIGRESHKRDRIRLLMEAYPDLPFVLIGDSGQEDPETYRRLAHEKPGRVRAVYIRDVSPDGRDREIEAIAEELRERGVPTRLVKTAGGAGEHAAEHGLITGAALERILEAAGNAPASETQI